MSQLDNYVLDVVYGCHLWQGSLGNNGRPVVWRGRRPSSAYVLVYEAAHGHEATHGTDAAPLVVDHLCRNVLCIRLEHLEACTKQENELRKAWRYRARRVLCPRGHALATTAIVTPAGGRVCRECNKTNKEFV